MTRFSSLAPVQQTGNQPCLKIAGRSGCRLELHDHKGEVLVRKYARSLDYNERLRKQFNKQQLFNEMFEGMRWFRAPRVIGEGLEAGTGLSWFSMDYVAGEKATAYLAQADAAAVKALLGKCLQYFAAIETRSVIGTPPRETITAKTIQLVSSLKRRTDIPPDLITRVAQFLDSRIPREKLPIGFCHGDFTLSNMLFGVYHIYLFDFLDSFIESPLIDIVKLRQDTRFYWTLLLDNAMPPHDAGRIKIALNYIDAGIVDYLESRRDFRAWYDYLEVYNLARILPYVSDSREVEFLLHLLNHLLVDTMNYEPDCSDGRKVHTFPEFAPEMDAHPS